MTLVVAFIYSVAFLCGVFAISKTRLSFSLKKWLTSFALNTLIMSNWTWLWIFIALYSGYSFSWNQFISVILFSPVFGYLQANKFAVKM